MRPLFDWPDLPDADPDHHEDDALDPDDLDAERVDALAPPMGCDGRHPLLGPGRY